MSDWVLGVDAGGTKTVAVAAGRSGRVLGTGRGGNGNFQDCGVARARDAIRRAVTDAVTQAAAGDQPPAAVCYGVSGADRPQDFATIDGMVRPLVSTPRLRLENDTIIALRAGTPDGVGVAVVAGTGSNTIGRAPDGTKLQVGGLGRLSGDFGSAGQLAEAGVVAAIMGDDGRGPPTALTSMITTHLGIARIEDVIELGFHDAGRVRSQIGELAPLVFEAASRGDAVARSILREAGEKMALAVGVILDRLFPGTADVPIVFGGSIFQRARDPLLFDTLLAGCRARCPGARFVRLEVEPVLGAVGFAFDDAGWGPDEKVWQELRASAGCYGGVADDEES